MSSFKIKFSQFILKTWVNSTVKISIIGLDNIDNLENGIVVAPHRSDQDPWVISQIIYKYKKRLVHWVYAGFLTNAPVFRQYMKTIKGVEVNLDGRINFKESREFIKKLSSNEIIGLFPEGTTYLWEPNTDFSNLTFSYTFIKHAVLHNKPVIPVVVYPVKYKYRKHPIPQWMRKIYCRDERLFNVKKRVVLEEVVVGFGSILDPAELEGDYKIKNYLLKELTKNEIDFIIKDIRSFLDAKENNTESNGFSTTASIR